MVFHWSLRGRISLQVTRTLLSILVDLNNVLVWMISTCPLTSKSSSLFNNPLVTVPKAPDFDVSEHLLTDIEVLYSQQPKLKPSPDLESSDFKAKLIVLPILFRACLLRLTNQDGETSIVVSSNRYEMTII